MATRARKRKQFKIGKVDMLSPGERKIIEVDGKHIGIFNVKGAYYALHNRCPHMGGNLCEGPVTGTSMPVDKTEFIYGRENELVRCGWHGWEFDIRTGVYLLDDKVRARKYQVIVEGDDLVLHI